MTSHPSTNPGHSSAGRSGPGAASRTSPSYEDWIAALLPVVPDEIQKNVKNQAFELRELVRGYVSGKTVNQELGLALAGISMGSSRVLAIACRLLLESDQQINLAAITEFVEGFCRRVQELAASGEEVLEKTVPGVSLDIRQALFDSESRFRTVFEIAPIGILVSGIDGKILSINPTLLKYIGIDLGAVSGKSVDDILATDETRDWIGHHYFSLLESPDGQDEIEGMLQIVSGNAFWANIVSSVVREEDGTPKHIVSLIEDRSVQHAYEHSLRQNEDRIRQLIQHSSDLLAVVSTSGQVTFISPNVEQILGYQVQELGARAFDVLVADEDRSLFEGMLGKMQEMPPSSSLRAEIRCVQRNQTWRWMEFSFTRMEGSSQPGRVVINARDTTERRELQKQLERQAFYDGLTALPNRLKFRVDLEQALENKATVAVLFIDLDRFKMINDSQDHGGGDHAIVAVGQRILETLLPGEMVGRFGGDEFAVSIFDATEAKALEAADRILQALARPLHLQHLDAAVPCSIGIALSNEQQNTANSLLRASDIAMYKAKALGGAQAVLFRPEMLDEAMARTELSSALHGALERNELETWYLPEYDLRTGRLAAFETVLRWRWPDHGLLDLEDFRASALDLGLLPRINAWMVEDATRQVMSWMRSGIDPDLLVFSINYVHPHRGPEHFLEKLVDALQSTSMEPWRVRVDLDSRVLTERDLAGGGIAAQLQGMGVPVGIDHFGRGPHPLIALNQAGADMVKISDGFLSISSDLNEALQVARLVLDTARFVAPSVTASGLDTNEALDIARKAGFDRGLGDACSKPQNAMGMERLLRSI